MNRKCEICGRPTPEKADRYCLRHQTAILEKLDEAGYLEPLTLMTVDGQQRLSRRRFLTVPEAPLRPLTHDSLRCCDE